MSTLPRMPSRAPPGPPPPAGDPETPLLPLARVCRLDALALGPRAAPSLSCRTASAGTPGRGSIPPASVWTRDQSPPSLQPGLLVQTEAEGIDPRPTSGDRPLSPAKLREETRSDRLRRQIAGSQDATFGGPDHLLARSQPFMAENPKDPKIPPPPFPPSTPLIGSTISHYRILERLGGGGMGVVYKGWDLKLERYAAVKFLSPHRSGSEDFKRRFAREARTASRLEHPNICTVFETDETDDGRLFIAMAFCEGESLKRKIERGPLPLPQALATAAQVAAGLAAAHDKGVVHRDIKPGNVMVADDGRVKIVDFGIARMADETRLTRTGDVMGTTAYISPEQFLSADIDHRSDLWSLGVVLYEMVTGRLPWTNGDERELISSIVKRPPRSVSTLRPGIPVALERVIVRALAKRPAERYQRADELRADLLAVAELVAEPAPSGPYEQTLIESPQPLAGRERRPASPPAGGPGDAGAPAAAGTGEAAPSGEREPLGHAAAAAAPVSRTGT